MKSCERRPQRNPLLLSFVLSLFFFNISHSEANTEKLIGVWDCRLNRNSGQDAKTQHLGLFEINFRRDTRENRVLGKVTQAKPSSLMSKSRLLETLGLKSFAVQGSKAGSPRLYLKNVQEREIHILLFDRGLLFQVAVDSNIFEQAACGKHSPSKGNSDKELLDSLQPHFSTRSTASGSLSGSSDSEFDRDLGAPESESEGETEESFHQPGLKMPVDSYGIPTYRNKQKSRRGSCMIL